MDDPTYLSLIQLDHVTYLTGCEIISGNENRVESGERDLAENATVHLQRPSRPCQSRQLAELGKPLVTEPPETQNPFFNHK